MGVWMGETKQAASSRAHHLHGNFYHWEKKKHFFQCGRQSFITQKKNCSAHKRPQKARRDRSGDLNNRAKDSGGHLLIMHPLTRPSALQLHRQ